VEINYISEEKKLSVFILQNIRFEVIIILSKKKFAANVINVMIVSARSTSSSPAPEEKEYIGGVPVVSFRDGSGSPSSVPQLPHIPGTAPLTPIGEASREQTTVVPLPPIGKGDLSTPNSSYILIFYFPSFPRHACTLLYMYLA
jgi:hypothetical protein